MKSYFTNRKQFVCLETFNSTIMDCSTGGVCQGSKMSGTLYNIYVNEIPEIHKLINDPIFKVITGNNTQYKYKNIQHETHNYIDDSNNIISFKDHSHV